MLISSNQNPQIKAACRVRDGHEPGMVFLEGARLVRDSLGSELLPQRCFHVPEPAEDISTLLPALAARGVQLFPVTPAVLKSLSDTVSPQGIVLLAQRPPQSAEAFWKKLPTEPLVVVLDRVQDPGNLGTILRTAEAAGADALLTLAGSADVFSPKVLRASMGSALRLPVLAGISRQDLVAAVRQSSWRMLAASGNGGGSHRDVDWRGPLLVVLGNEGSGVEPDLLAACQERVRIPIRSTVESLNVATAAAVLLFEAAHQRASRG